jgi:hypothetical protein
MLPLLEPIRHQDGASLSFPVLACNNQDLLLAEKEAMVLS